ncbi:MAG TPA: SCO family protein [Chthoniobacteraceae bacterium]|nr:SCO family protein [Chthoniobacteraceae bacterium]
MKWPFFITLLSGLTILNCGADEAKSSAKPPCCREALPLGAYTDQSLYQLDSKWTSDVSRELKLGVLRGRPQVLVMFFAQCEYACPRLVHNLKALESAMKVDLRQKVDFLLISFDSDRDTPEALRAYREKNKLGMANWTLLRGAGDDVRELAALLGINYVKDARGQFAHSNVVTVLNADGEIAYQHQGLEDGSLKIIEILERLTADAARPSGRKTSQ